MRDEPDRPLEHDRGLSDELVVSSCERPRKQGETHPGCARRRLRLDARRAKDHPLRIDVAAEPRRLGDRRERTLESDPRRRRGARRRAFRTPRTPRPRPSSARGRPALGSGSGAPDRRRVAPSSTSRSARRFRARSAGGSCGAAETRRRGLGARARRRSRSGRHRHRPGCDQQRSAPASESRS